MNNKLVLYLLCFVGYALLGILLAKINLGVLVIPW